MAGAAHKLNAIHASREERGGRFRQVNVVEASVTMLGRTFTTTIREGATTNDLIEKVARENGGEVAKRYYPEFKTWEITSVRIGDAILMKSSESGIHFSLGEAGIPMAVTENQGIVFPNADELRIGRNTSNIALWTTSANFDPGNVGDLDRMYKGSGGVRLSQDARDEISKAHGGVRSGNGILLEENILVLNKDTGEVLTASQHASRISESPVPAAIQGMLAVSASPGSTVPASFSASAALMPLRPDHQPAMHEHARYDPALFDAFRSGTGNANPLVIGTFDGSISDIVSVSYNPFSQDVCGFASATLPQMGAPARKPVSATSGPSIDPAPQKRLSFCMLAFSPLAQGPPIQGTNRAATPSAGPINANTHNTRGNLKSKSTVSSQEPLDVPSIESAYAAWKAARFKPADLQIPSGLSFVGNWRRVLRPPFTLSDAGDLLRKPLGGTVQATLMLAARLLAIAKLVYHASRRAAKAAETAQKKNRAPKPLATGKKKPGIRKPAAPEAGPARHIKASPTKAKNRAADARERPEAETRGARKPGKPHKAGKPVPRRNELGVAKSHTAQPIRSKRARKAAILAERNLVATGIPKASRASSIPPARPSGPSARAGAASAAKNGKKPPKHVLWEMLGLHWKKRGRKFRMKKNSAP